MTTNLLSFKAYQESSLNLLITRELLLQDAIDGINNLIGDRLLIAIKKIDKTRQGETIQMAFETGQINKDLIKIKLRQFNKQLIVYIKQIKAYVERFRVLRLEKNCKVNAREIDFHVESLINHFKKSMEMMMDKSLINELTNDLFINHMEKTITKLNQMPNPPVLIEIYKD